MLYYKCPTCKTVLANKQLLYEKELDNICKNTSLSTTEKDKLKSNIMEKIELKNYCCKMRMMGYVKLIDIIK